MAHLGERGFDAIGGSVVSTTAFTVENFGRPEYLARFSDEATVKMNLKSQKQQ